MKPRNNLRRCGANYARLGGCISRRRSPPSRWSYPLLRAMSGPSLICGVSHPYRAHGRRRVRRCFFGPLSASPAIPCKWGFTLTLRLRIPQSRGCYHPRRLAVPHPHGCSTQRLWIMSAVRYPRPEAEATGFYRTPVQRTCDSRSHTDQDASLLSCSCCLNCTHSTIDYRPCKP